MVFSKGVVHALKGDGELLLIPEEMSRKLRGETLDCPDTSYWLVGKYSWETIVDRPRMHADATLL